MIFRQWRQVLDGTKTQTRRLAKQHDHLGWYLFSDGSYLQVVLRWKTTYEERGIPEGYYYPIYAIGRTYAVVPKRGENGVGHFCFTEIRREQLQDIDGPDCLAEGLSAYDDQGVLKTWPDLIEEYTRLWDSIHKKPGTQMEDDPDVWVLTLEIVKGNGDAKEN